VTRQSDHANVVSEIFTAKLRAQSELLRRFQQFLLQCGIAKRLTVLVAFRWQRVIVMR